MAQKINNPITLCGCNAFPQLRNSFSQKEKYGSVHVMILRSARTSSKEYLRFPNPSATKKFILQCYLSSFLQGERLANCQNIRKPDPQSFQNTAIVWQLCRVVPSNCFRMLGEGVWVRAALWSSLSLAFLSRLNFLSSFQFIDKFSLSKGSFLTFYTQGKPSSP